MVLRSSILNGRLRGDSRGQFAILASLIIAAFVFSLVITISQLSMTRQEASYEPVDELVLAITSDFERCLTRALATATQNYCETWNLNFAGEVGEAFVDAWRRAILESYNGFGINIALMVGESLGKGVGWEIRWDENYGMSMVYTTFDMDVEAYGLKGLTVTMQKIVHLIILDANMESSGAGSKMVMVFQIYLSDGRGRFRPISDITRDNLKLLINGTVYKNYDIEAFDYLGAGRYNVTFDFKGNKVIAEKATLIVNTSDGIMVAATRSFIVVQEPPAAHEPSRPAEWQMIYISPERPLRGGGPDKNFMLVLYPPEDYSQIAPPLNNKWDNRSGNTTKTTPKLMLGDTVNITLYAKYTKQGYIDVKVTLGFFDSNGAFTEIGSNTIRINKSSGYLKYEITFEPKVKVIPEGSLLTLTFMRMDDGTGGTFHILCGLGKSSIKLW